MELTIKIICKANDISRRLPINIIERDISLFNSEINKSLPTVFRYEIKKCFVDDNGIVFDKLNVLKDLLIWPAHASMFNFKYLIKKYFQKKISLEDNRNYYLCFDYWSIGYFHWICEVLPRLILIEEELKQKTSVLLLPVKFNKGFYRETLKIFGDIEVFWIPENTYLYCKTLISPNRVAASGSNNPTVIKLVRDKVLKHYGCSFAKKKNIYISRVKANRRKIINEKDVLDILSEFDFEIVCFEDYSFEEQIRLVQGAKNLISLHGANLTNLLFLCPESNVLEFRKKDDRENNYYYALADAIGIGYYYQLCDYEKISDIGNNFNLIVNLQELRLNVIRMLKGI